MVETHSQKEPAVYVDIPTLYVWYGTSDLGRPQRGRPSFLGVLVIWEGSVTRDDVASSPTRETI